MKSGPVSSPVGSPVSIGEIAVTGVDAGVARRIGPAIEQALPRAAAQGLSATVAHDIAISLPHGASARQIVEAVINALTGRGRSL